MSQRPDQDLRNQDPAVQYLREEDLILYFYGEARNTEDIRQRLETSDTDQKRYNELCRMLELASEMPVPEPHEDYGARVWRRIQPKLDETAAADRFRRWLEGFLGPRLPARRLMTGAALVALLAIAFAAGRQWPSHDAANEQGLSAAGRERILLVAVGEHLERSEMLLIELANAPRDGSFNLSSELRLAEELLPANRLYRQAASRADQSGIADVLDDLERLLLDIAHCPELAGDGLDELQSRIRSGDTLFRVQVVGSRVQRLEPTTPTSSTLGDV